MVFGVHGERFVEAGGTWVPYAEPAPMREGALTGKVVADFYGRGSWRGRYLPGKPALVFSGNGKRVMTPYSELDIERGEPVKDILRASGPPYTVEHVVQVSDLVDASYIRGALALVKKDLEAEGNTRPSLPRGVIAPGLQPEEAPQPRVYPEAKTATSPRGSLYARFAEMVKEHKWLEHDHRGEIPGMIVDAFPQRSLIEAKSKSGSPLTVMLTSDGPFLSVHIFDRSKKVLVNGPRGWERKPLEVTYNVGPTTAAIMGMRVNDKENSITFRGSWSDQNQMTLKFGSSGKPGSAKVLQSVRIQAPGSPNGDTGLTPNVFRHTVEAILTNEE
jgi:hypothetical protein